MPQIAQIMEWIRQNTSLVYKSTITIDKNDNNYIKDLYGTQNHFRNYLNLSEYCLFYTFQDETGLTTVMLDTNNFSTLRKYFKDYQDALGLNKKNIIQIIGQKADHCFRWGSSQWDLPTKETYAELEKLPLKYEDLRREYEDLRREYEDLRREYEDLRYTFNAKDGIKNVWVYSFRKDKRAGHPTQKPITLIEDIIKYSSNENHIVLDPFMGSGTTAIAALNTGRFFIGFELDKGYYDLACKRIEEHQKGVIT